MFQVIILYFIWKPHLMTSPLSKQVKSEKRDPLLQAETQVVATGWSREKETERERM